jgi:hypothetical protein
MICGVPAGLSAREKRKETTVKKTVTACVAIMGLSMFAATGYANGEQESRDLSREKKLFRNYAGEGSTSVTSLCMEGHVFVLVNGNISNQTSITQVYEERNGKVLPKRCE